MQVQSVANNRASVKFSADPNTERAKAFVNMKDSQLKTLAYVTAHDKKTEKRTRKSITSTLYALPIAASLSSGILTKGELGTKAIATAKSAGSWGFALLTLGVFNAAKNAVVSRSEKLQNFEQNNPIVSTLADVGLFLGALSLGNKGAKRVAAKVFEKAPNFVAKMFTKLENAEKAINKTILNTKFLPSIKNNIAKLENKAPWAVHAGTAVVANSVLILFLAGLIRGNSDAKQAKKNVEQNYKALKTAQFETARHLTNVMSVRSDVLAQGSPIASEVNEYVR